MTRNQTKTEARTDGLDGVVVAETEISGIDGERGRLWVRGHDVETLAHERTFEELLALLLEGALPDEEGLSRWRSSLGIARLRAFEDLWRMGAALEAENAMDALRAATACLEEDGVGNGSRTSRTIDTRIIGALPVFAAAWHRRRQDLAPVPPDPGRSHAEDFLHMLHDAEPHPARVLAMNRYWVTVAEHGMNASTFVARVVASTHSDKVSIVTAALGALKGPLHGGAPGPVLDMLDAIDTHGGSATTWLRAELAAGRRIMGLGHRVYRVRDPRAAVLEEATQQLQQAGLSSAYLERARRAEKAANRLLAELHPERTLAANVEFYTAVLLDGLGLPRTLFTATFAVARVAGWLAHAAEQRDGGRILRPRQRYVGARPDLMVSA
ncbi:MAG: citrate synthase [bacterium]|nr:citrate synthase [bacterium]MCP5070331.1 citrate synthase [bacterium]